MWINPLCYFKKAKWLKKRGVWFCSECGYIAHELVISGEKNGVLHTDLQDKRCPQCKRIMTNRINDFKVVLRDEKGKRIQLQGG